LWTIAGPFSWYSSLVTHMFWKVESEDRVDPPIHTRNFLYAGATTLTCMEEGARAVTSLLSLSEMPGNMVLPPDITILW
jgi:hypothetical protein